MTGIVTASPGVSSDQDLQLLITVTLDGTAMAPLDATAGPVKFPCSPGQVYQIFQVDVNAIGASPQSAVVTGTVPTIVIPPTAVPAQPGVPTVTFTNP